MQHKRVLSICAFAFLSVIAAMALPFAQVPTTDYLISVITQPGTFQPLPTAQDPFWKSNISDKVCASYEQLAQPYIGKSWEQIPDSLFSEFRKNGNRNRYEAASFALRKQMATLTIAEILNGQGTHIQDIIAGLRYFSAEPWWGIPAHYNSDRPQRDNQIVDLFNSETACLLAWTTYMLRDRLESHAPGICEQIRKEIERRILTPALTIDYDWKRRTSNWNPWICSNWLTCVLLCEQNRDRQIKAIEQIIHCMDYFYDSYPEDGGCDEGPDYWDKAAGAFYECLHLLDLASDGHLSMKDDQKLSNMAAYIYRTYIGNNYYVNFADSNPRIKPHINLIYPFGTYIGDTILKQYAAYLGKSGNIPTTLANAYKSSGNIPQLGRELIFLSLLPEFLKETIKEPTHTINWMPGHQVFINQDAQFLLAAKGGNNAENHNHNDIGNFIVYSNGQPLIIDIGTSAYNAQTFSNKRYELTHTRSAFHNVPLINGIEQAHGHEYAAKKVQILNSPTSTGIRLDLSKAYPKSAKVKAWIRTLTQEDGEGVIIHEQYKLKSYQAPTQLMLICYGKPVCTSEGRITLQAKGSKIQLLFNPEELSAGIEKITSIDSSTSNSWGKTPLYRIILTVKGKAKKGNISYRIVKEK